MNIISSSTWQIIDKFWNLDLSQIDELMKDRYSVFGPEPRLPSDMLRAILVSAAFKITSYTRFAADLKNGIRDCKCNRHYFGYDLYILTASDSESLLKYKGQNSIFYPLIFLYHYFISLLTIKTIPIGIFTFPVVILSSKNKSFS